MNQEKEPLIIQFLLPIAGVAGGVRVVYQYASYLQSLGHTVRILYPGVLFPKPGAKWSIESKVRSFKYWLEKVRGKSEGSWFNLTVPLIHTPSLEEKYIPDADITIATGNETADWAVKLPKRCGTLFYFIQGYETWTRDEETVRATWKYPLKKIVVSQKLADIAKELDEEILGIVPVGIDTQAFNNYSKRFNTPPRILMLSHDSELKGIPDGFKAVEIARQKYPDLQLVMFGTQPPRSDMPAGTEYHQSPNLTELYAGADIFLCPSWSEGGPLTPMEAMACGTAVVSTDVGAVTTYTVPGETALVVPIKQPEKLSDALITLLDNPELLQKISSAGHVYIQDFTIEKSAALFAETLLRNR